MATRWIIRKYESDALMWEKSVPGNLREKRIEIILQRLVAQDLAPDEVLAASLNANTLGRMDHFDRVGRGVPITYGHNPYYIAVHKTN
jgi:hypothetical protein